MKKLLVLGNPIDHSKSPIIHNTWLKKYKKKSFYDKLKIEEHEIKGIINKIKSNELIGANVTLPHKKNVIKYLDILEENSINSGAVNTIYKKNSKIIGANTDGDGFLSSVKNDAGLIINKKSNIFIIGAGGAARGIIFSLVKKNVNKILITNRTSTKIVDLLNDVKSNTKYNELITQKWGNNIIPNDVDLVVNTSSFGMKKNEHLYYDFSNCKENLLVYDIIYSPEETYFLKIAKGKGFKIQNGMGMLIRQAALSFYKWFGKEITEDDIIEMINSFKEQF
jgi:shikimate dehydrogenase